MRFSIYVTKLLGTVNTVERRALAAQREGIVVRARNVRTDWCVLVASKSQYTYTRDIKGAKFKFVRKI